MAMSTRLDDVTLLTLYSVKDAQRGTLCVAEYGKHIPFDMKRIFYLYDMPVNTVRGQHAHRQQDQFLICLTGSVELSTERKHCQQTFTLSHPHEGVYFPPMTWVGIKVLEPSTMCLVVSSGAYDEDDYIRNHEAFESLLRNS